MAIDFTEFTLPRWARTALGVDVTDPNDAVEPPGQQKDTGWVETDTPSYNLWNWMWRETYKSLLYLVERAGEIRSAPQVARSGLATTPNFDFHSNMTIGSNFAGNPVINAGTAFIDGHSYNFPQTTVTVATQSTLASMLSYIVAELVGGVPTITLVRGTVNATLPTLTDQQVPLYSFAQGAGIQTLLTVQDERQFGVVDVDRVEVYGDGNTRIRTFVDRSVSGGPEPRFLIENNNGSYQYIEFDPSTGVWIVDKDVWQLKNDDRPTHEIWIGWEDFVDSGDQAAEVVPQPTLQRLFLDANPTANSVRVRASIPHIPPGATFTEIAVWGDITSSVDNGASVQLIRVDPADNTVLQTVLSVGTSSGSSGPIFRESVGNAVAKVAGGKYVCRIQGSQINTAFFGVRIRYTLPALVFQTEV